jgi:hypothetical protein
LPVGNGVERNEERGIDRTAQVSFMITAAQRAALRERGHTDEQIRSMTPAEAHAELAGGTATCPVCGFDRPEREVARGEDGEVACPECRRGDDDV